MKKEEVLFRFSKGRKLALGRTPVTHKGTCHMTLILKTTSFWIVVAELWNLTCTCAELPSALQGKERESHLVL